MKSTRDIGQSLSMKKRLQHIFKRHKAGIELTDEEHQLLFLPRSENLRMDIFDIDDEGLKQVDNSGTSNSLMATSVLGNRNQDLLENNASINQSISENITPIFTLSQLLGTNVVNAKSAVTTSANVNNSEPYAITKSTIALTGNHKVSLGSSLLQQFQHLKSLDGATLPSAISKDSIGK